MTLYVVLSSVVLGICLFQIVRARFGGPPAEVFGPPAAASSEGDARVGALADPPESASRRRALAVIDTPPLTYRCDAPQTGHGVARSIAPIIPSADARGGLNPATSTPGQDLSARVLQVVVADDNAIDQRRAAALLESAGHRVTLVANGRKAVEAVRNGHYDIVLMAMRMAVMDGLQAANHIRSLPPPKCDIPIVGMTADAAQAGPERHRGAGMDACLRKPLSAEALDVINPLTAAGRPPRLLADGVPALDKSAVDMLREFLTPEQLDALLAESLVDIEARIKRLSVCLNHGHDTFAAKEAHDLVSVAGNCGASALSALARDIERACKQDRTADARQAFARMPGAAAEASKAVAGLRRALAGNASALNDWMTEQADIR